MKKIIIACIAACFIFTACSVFQDEPIKLDGQVSKVFLNPITNATNKYGLSMELMNALANEINYDGRLDFVNSPAQADQVLSISVISYVLEPLTYDDMMNVEQYKLEVSVSVEAKAADSGDVLWTNPSLTAIQIYRNEIDLSAALSVENEARQVAWEKLSRMIVREIRRAYVSPDEDSGV
jgi:hypothetical protein